MDLHLTLSLSNASSKTHFPNKKRSFPQLKELVEQTSSNTNGSDVMIPTLSLLPLTPHGHSDHHDHEPSCQSSTSTITKRGEDDGEALLGWPPVSYRKKKHSYNEDQEVSSNYVKVKMEGVGIARKVNLTPHHSFQTLNQTLMHMFGKCDDDQQQYELVYQDKEGDWILAQDVSWRSFMECAQRLKLLQRRG